MKRNMGKPPLTVPGDRRSVHAAKHSSHTLENLLASLKSCVTELQAKKDGVKKRNTLWHTKLVYNAIKGDAHVSS
jgi:hypothetical protein